MTLAFNGTLTPPKNFTLLNTKLGFSVTHFKFYPLFLKIFQNDG